MTYLEPRKKNSRSKIFVAVISAILIVIAVVHFFLPAFWPTLLGNLALPFWRAEFVLESGALSSVENLMNENESLKRSLSEAQVRSQTASFLERENEGLKAMLGRASSTPLILAAVLKRPPFAPYDELIIDIGSDFRLSSSSQVFAPGEVPLGRISQVYDHSAKVILFSSPGMKHEVLIGQENTPALAVGRGGGQYEAELPRGLMVKEGDYVIAPALNGSPLGIVTSVISDTTEPFEKVLFSSPVNPYELRWVLVVPDSK